MKYETILERLKSYRVQGDWPPTIFLLPEGAMRDIYDCVVANELRSGIELGTGLGATSCVIAAALEEVGGGRVVTIDKTLHMPANANVLKEYTGIGDSLEFVLEPLGYNWYLADLIAKQTSDDVCEPIFDFCLIDGAHEFEPDALAFTLVAKLLKPGGWVVFDDINFYLRSMSFWQQTHGHLSDRELDTCQIGMVYDYIVKQRPDFTGFLITENGRVGWARKRVSGFRTGEGVSGAGSLRPGQEQAIHSAPEHTNGEQQTVRSLRAQVAEKEWLAKQLQSQLAHSEAELSKITSTLAWRLLSVYGRRIKYPYLMPIYRMLGLTPSGSKHPTNEQITEARSRYSSPVSPEEPSTKLAQIEDQVEEVIRLTTKDTEDEEFFRPLHGLELEPYLALEDLFGIYHLSRYHWVKHVLETFHVGKVLDMACGAGYGSYILAGFLPEAQVTGADYDPRAVELARNTYRRPNLRFVQGDMVSWTTAVRERNEHLGTYDAMVCFDTIEHVVHRDIALLRIVENLTEHGVLALSTPCAYPETVLRPEWRCHQLEYAHHDLKNLLRRFFAEILAPEDNTLPYMEYWRDVVNKDKPRYLNLANPLVCVRPIK